MVTGFAAAIEITSGTISTLFKLTEIRDTDLGKKILEYLFWLELLSLSGELTVAIHNGLRKSARKLVQKPEDAAKLEKQLDDLVENGQISRKQADEVVEELRMVAGVTVINKFEDAYKIRYIGRKLQNLVDEATALAKYGKIGKQTVQEVNIQVQKLVSSLSKTKLERHVMVSGMTYAKNGIISKTFVRHNFTKMEGIDEIGKLASNGKFLDDLGNPTKYQKFLEDMHPTLRKRYDKHMLEVKKGLNADPSDIARAGVEASHGEIRALDDLLKEIDPLGKLGDDVFKDIVGYNRFLPKVGIQPPCVHCHFLTTNVTFIGL